MQNSATILHARSRYHEWQGSGALSIKTFHGGQAHYQVAGAHHLVDDSCYLVLNAGQEYTITVDAPTPVESFCLFFAPGFAESVYHSISLSPEALLDAPVPPLPISFCFYERTYPHDDRLSPALAKLRTASANQPLEAGWLEEQLHWIMQELLSLQRKTQAEVAALPYLRAATREELYRRIYQARDFMVAMLDQALTIDEIAAHAALSPNHFLRTFKQVFHQTPHQYLMQQRLQRAAFLLRTTKLPVTEIGLAVGFASLGSFSWRFRHAFGQAPEQYRRTKR